MVVRDLVADGVVAEPGFYGGPSGLIVGGGDGPAERVGCLHGEAELVAGGRGGIACLGDWGEGGGDDVVGDVDDLGGDCSGGVLGPDGMV